MKSTAPQPALEVSDVEWEVSAYMQEPSLPGEVDPLLFWQVKKSMYPLLEVAARNHLAIPASSGPSEWVFSISGRMFSPTRSRLRGHLAEALMHVKCSK